MGLTGRVLALLVLQWAALPSFGADRFDEIRNYIRAELVARSVPSVAVAVAQGDRILWEEGFGWADIEQRRAATEHTPYSLASISKPITATGLMLLVQQGKIDLDRPVNDYLGFAKLNARAGSANDATVRRVANHTSGLPLHYQFFYADEPYARPSMDETILRYGNLLTAPGETFQYSNLGYGVLDYVISRVSGMSYAEFMRREVFLPLGMTQTTVGLPPGGDKTTAIRYGVDGLPIPDYDFDHPGGSAVFASAHDLVRFGQFHVLAHLRDQKQILSDDTIASMKRVGEAGRPDSLYGIGFNVQERNGYKIYAHGGGMGGVATQLILVADQKLSIAVLSNARSALAFDVADRIVKRMLPKLEQPTTPPRPAEPAKFAPDESLQGTWRGTLFTYTKPLPVELTILPSGDVHAKVGDQLDALVNNVRMERHMLSGSLIATIGTPDTERYKYIVEMLLRRRGDEMTGAMTAVGEGKPRVRNALSHWVTLTKDVSKPAS
jgi:CubicO group peptidase (beta-lactamase class C family)